MHGQNHKESNDTNHDLKALIATRDTIRSLLSGVLLLFLSISIIVIQNRKELVSMLLDNQASLQEIVPVIAFFFACCHIWYYTFRAAKIMRKRLQLWIGNVRAVVLVGLIVVIINYL